VPVLIFDSYRQIKCGCIAEHNVRQEVTIDRNLLGTVTTKHSVLHAVVLPDLLQNMKF
jgi:hypothetical protein